MSGCFFLNTEYIGLQVFTLGQKSKVGVRIIFDGVLYSKFYGYICFYLLRILIDSHMTSKEQTYEFINLFNS